MITLTEWRQLAAGLALMQGIIINDRQHVPLEAVFQLLLTYAAPGCGFKLEGRGITITAVPDDLGRKGEKP